jgi:hypothetical protein
VPPNTRSRNASIIHPDADEEQHEAESVGQRGERALGADEADDRRNQEQHPEKAEIQATPRPQW